MKATNELFQLIRTLTSSEKRYFKTNAKRENANSNYLLLFDAIDAQKEYDEGKLKKKHAGKKFIKYLSAEKNYLQEQIMKNMRAFHVESTVDNKINDLLQDEAFYRAKGLNDLRKKTISKAKKLAKEYERFHLLQEVIFREITFVQEFSTKVLDEPVKDLVDEQNKVHETQRKMIGLWSLSQEIFSIYRSGADFKDESVRDYLEGLKEKVEALSDRIDGSPQLTIKFNIAMSDYYQCLRISDRSFNHLWNNYLTYQDRPQAKTEYLIQYRILLSNLVGRAYSAGKDELFMKLLDELKSLPANSFNAEGEVFQNVYFLEHLRYLGRGECDKALALIPDIEDGLKKYSAKINTARRLSFEYNIMIMYFLMHRFKEAQAWAEKILDEKSEIKQEATTVTRVLYPIIHFELGHQELVENLTRSAYRYLLKLKRLHGFERLMIKYLEKMPLSADSEEFGEKLRELSADLVELRENPTEKVTLGFEEVDLWVRSHLEEREMKNLIPSL